MIVIFFLSNRFLHWNRYDYLGIVIHLSDLWGQVFMECPRVNLNDIFLNLPGICALVSSSELSNSSELEQSVLINSWNILCDCVLSWIGWGDSYLTSWDCWNISWLTFNLRLWDFLLPLLDQFVSSIFFNYARHLPEPQSYSWPCLQGLLEFLYLLLFSLMKFLSNSHFFINRRQCL